MSTSYRYNEPEKTVFETLPEGEYDFTVIEAGEPYTNPKSGNFILPVKLQVGVAKKHVYDYPWSGENGDKIAQFLKACNRAPEVGQEPAWNKLIGAKGRVHIQIQAAEGQYPEKNKVAWYIFATDIKNGSSPKRSQVGGGEVAPMKKHTDPDLDHEPDDLPF